MQKNKKKGIDSFPTPMDEFAFLILFWCVTFNVTNPLGTHIWIISKVDKISNGYG